MLKEFIGYLRGESRDSRTSESSQGEEVPEVEDDQPRNPYDEIQILTGHSDLVHFMTRLSDYKILTAGHDNGVYVWCCQSGQMLFALEGHQKPVLFAKAMKYSQRSGSFSDDEYEEDRVPAILTMSSDKSMMVWSMSDGARLKTITEHGSEIKFVIELRGEDVMHCSGGKDICVWDSGMNLLAQRCRTSQESIQFMVPVKDNKIVVSTNKPELYVYEVARSNSDTSEYYVGFYKEIKAHRESISGLITISDSMFASASLDGSIVVWTSYLLSPTKKFNYHDTYVNEKSHLFTYSVRYFFVLEQRYIFATIASGFAVFDPITDRCLVKVQNAHHAQINYMALVNDGYLLATCSNDATVRLWGSPSPVAPSDIQDRKVALLPLERLIGRRIRDLKGGPATLELVGECAGHSGNVQLLVECGSEGFVSSGTDGLLILWKDGVLLRDKRDRLVKKIVTEIGLFDH